MTEYRNRGARCPDGFLKGLCPLPSCWAWDGRSRHQEQRQTISHEAWGKRQPRRPEPKEPEVELLDADWWDR